MGARQVAECETSGQTACEWCKDNGVPEATMHWWRRRLRMEAETAFARHLAGSQTYRCRCSA